MIQNGKYYVELSLRKLISPLSAVMRGVTDFLAANEKKNYFFFHVSQCALLFDLLELTKIQKIMKYWELIKPFLVLSFVPILQLHSKKNPSEMEVASRYKLLTLFTLLRLLVKIATAAHTAYTVWTALEQ